MNTEDLRSYCLAKKAVTESLPFDDTTLVFKVCNKMFALMGLDNQPPRINLKCDPERAVLLRETYENILPGYHMNKKHWNTVIIDGSQPDDFIEELIDHSYDLIVKKLTRKQRENCFQNNVNK